MIAKMKRLAWQIGFILHRWDYAYVLPTLARLPLSLGFWLARGRGICRSALGIDWRSMALGFRHIAKQSTVGLKILQPDANPSQINQWRRQRFITEGQDEFDAQLIAQRRVLDLNCSFTPKNWQSTITQTNRGILFLTLHYDSFYLGSLFLAKTGIPVNIMSSAITHHPKVDKAVQHHFVQKYRGSEPYLNGGQVLDMELGLRPFYRILEAKQILMMLGDAPVLPNGTKNVIPFLGGPRLIAGGPLRLAIKTNSLIGAYICHCEGPGRYSMQIHEPKEASLQTIESIYQFFSTIILQDPGKWWAVDLLPQMPIVES